MLRLALIISLALIASCTRYVAAPSAPAQPQPSHVEEAKPVGNQAVAFGMSWLPKIDPSVKCAPRTGRESAIESSVDTATCTSDGVLSKSILICRAPADAKSTCEVAADWNPPAAQPHGEFAKQEPATAPPPKSKGK